MVKFFYNDKGHRVKKEAYISGSTNLDYIEHYVRDAAGTALAIYRDGAAKEHTIYGASRLGVYYRTGGNSVYQLTDHLGNVRAVVQRNNSTPEAVVATDYYPFGMPMPGRNDGANSYRYAYQGQEKDQETQKEAFELRLWDSRIGRWLTTDPYGQYTSPYLGMGNNPINGVDSDGGFWQELGNFLTGNGWISNEGLNYLQSNEISDYRSRYSKNPFDSKGYHTVGYTDPKTGELTFHRFKNVDDLGPKFDFSKFDYTFKVSAGLQVNADLSDLFAIKANILSRTLLTFDSKNGFRGKDFYGRNLELNTGFGGSFYGLNVDLSVTGSEINDKGETRPNGGLQKLILNGNAGFTSLLQVGVETDLFKQNSTQIYRQHGLGAAIGAGVVVEFGVGVKKEIFK